MTLHQALIDTLGRDKASECWEACFCPITSMILNRPALDIVKFDKHIQTPNDKSLKEHLKSICGDKQTQYEAIVYGLGVSDSN